VATRLKHQGMANPIVFAQEMLAFFAHGVAHEIGSSACYESDGVAACVGVNAEECFGCHFLIDTIF